MPSSLLLAKRKPRLSGNPAGVALALLSFLALLFAGQAFGANDPEPDRLRIGKDIPLSVLEDRTGQLSLDEVLAMPPERFRQLPHALAAGYTPSAFWLRLELPASVRAGEEWWLEIFPSNLDEVTLFEPTAGGWQKIVSGDLAPFAERELPYHNFLFRIHATDSGKTLYLRVHSTSTIVVNGSLWRPDAFTRAAIDESLGAGLYFGIWIIALIIFLIYALAFRYHSYFTLLVVSALVALLVAALHGYHAQYLFPNSPVLASGAVSVLVCLVIASQAWLVRALMDTKAKAPRIDKVLLVLGTISALSVISVFTGDYGRVVPLLSLTLPFFAIVGLVLAVTQVRDQRPGAYILLLAFAIHLLVIISNFLILFGFLPPHPLLHSGWQLEAPFHLLLIHGALVARIWQTEKTLKRILEEALEAALRTEKELERRVDDRTQELAAANETLRDEVTMRTRLADELTEAKQVVETALANERRSLLEQRQFMSMVSHEFRTPLAIIDLAATNLTEVPLEGEKDLAERSQQILRAVRRLARLMENTITDDRIAGEALAPQITAASPEALVQEAAEIVQWSPRHHLNLELDDLPATLLCDPTLVRMALSNLIDNAVKYSPEGTVTVKAWASPSHVCFEVADQGPGIPAANRETIFQRFMRGDNARGKPGSGLGLHLARQIAKLHSGSLELADNNGSAGATFIMMLARHPAPSDAAASDS